MGLFGSKTKEAPKSHIMSKQMSQLGRSETCINSESSSNSASLSVVSPRNCSDTTIPLRIEQLELKDLPFLKHLNKDLANGCLNVILSDFDETDKNKALRELFNDDAVFDCYEIWKKKMTEEIDRFGSINSERCRKMTEEELLQTIPHSLQESSRKLIASEQIKALRVFLLQHMTTQMGYLLDILQTKLCEASDINGWSPSHSSQMSHVGNNGAPVHDAAHSHSLGHIPALKVSENVKRNTFSADLLHSEVSISSPPQNEEMIADKNISSLSSNISNDPEFGMDTWTSEQDQVGNGDNYTNILLLGETGIGKTTFINALANYASFNSFEEAKNRGPIVLIDTKFSCMDDDYNLRNVFCEPTHGTMDSQYQNERHCVGESATQRPASYVFQYETSAKETKYVRIIDGPGMGDTRGIEADRKNIDNILRYARSLSKLHAVCLFFAPNKSRMTPILEVYLRSFLESFHYSLATNILFVFTHASQTQFQIGESFSTLSHFLKNVNGITKKIELNRSSSFLFDSDSFRLLCAYKTNVAFPAGAYEECTNSWNFSVKEAKRLFETVGKLKPHQFRNLLSEECASKAVCRIVPAIFEPLLTVLCVILSNFIELKKESEELNKCSTANHAKVEALKKHSENKLLELEVRQLHKPQGQVSCERFSCKVAEKNRPTRNCSFNIGENCDSCGCAKSNHTPKPYETSMKDVTDETRREILSRNCGAGEKFRGLLAHIECQKKSLLDDVYKIIEICARLTLFSEKSKMATTNSFSKLLMKLISLEENAATRNNLLIGSLRKFQEKLAKSMSMCKKQAINEDMIEADIATLYSLTSRAQLSKMVDSLTLPSMEQSERIKDHVVEVGCHLFENRP